MGAVVLDPGMKPDEWGFDSGLVATKWGWFWSHIGFCFPFWSSLQITDLARRSIISDPSGTDTTRFTFKGGGIHRTSEGGGEAFYTVNSGITQNQYTLISVATVEQNDFIKSFFDDDSGGGDRKFQFRADTNEDAQFIVFNTAGAAFTATGTTRLLHPAIHVIIARVLGSVGSIWIDGIKEDEVTITGSPETPNTTVRLFERKVAAFTPFFGTQFMIAAIDRAFSDSEIEIVSRDPFGPFRMADEIPVVGLSVAFTSANLALHHSGGADIGGAIGAALTDDALNNLWDDVSSGDASAGDTEYRCTYVKNTHGSLSVANVKVEIDTDPTESNFEIALGAAGKNGTETEVANEDTAPSGPVFGTTALSLGTLAAGDFYPIWVKRIVSAGAGAATPDSGVLNILGDDPN